MDTLNEAQKSSPIDILMREVGRGLSLEFMSQEDAKFLIDTPPPIK